MAEVHLDVLERVRIASPCPVKWDDMVGDERVRHCDQCDLKVHNISGMSRDEAQAFLTQAAGIKAQGGRVCAGFWKRADGTIITRDCPVGLAGVRARVARCAARGVVAVGMVLTAVVAFGARRKEEQRLRLMEPFASLARWMNPIPPAPPPLPMPGIGWAAGDICLPLPQVTPTVNQGIGVNGPVEDAE